MAVGRLLTFGTATVILVTGLSPEITSARAAKNGLVYVGTYTDHESKGIYAYRFDSRTGRLTSLGLTAESANPSFLTSDSRGNFLYAINNSIVIKGSRPAP